MDDGIFDSALSNQRSVSETFFLDLSADQTIAQNLHQSDEAVQRRIRQFMESANSPTQFLFDFQTYGNDYDEEVAADLINGEIAAIDSTDVLPVTDLMSTSFYAVGVGCITSRTRYRPEFILTTTHTSYTRPNEIADNNENLWTLCDELDNIRQTKGSWATTFREYQEREVAISCESQIVLLDGPIFTQNLITQNSGRELYSRMMQTSKRFIGVIKDLGSSWAISRWTAMSLEREEGFVLCPIQDQYRQRFRERGNRQIEQWIDSLSGQYIRVVYRPAEKAFAFECTLDDLPYAVSLLRQDASPTMNHEIPLLLETVDSHLRGSNNSQAIQHSFYTEIQRNNYRMGVDITNERNYR